MATVDDCVDRPLESSITFAIRQPFTNFGIHLYCLFAYKIEHSLLSGSGHTGLLVRKLELILFNVIYRRCHLT